MMSVKAPHSYVFQYLACKNKTPVSLTLSCQSSEVFSLLKYLQLINCVDSMLFDDGLVWSAI